MFQYNNRGYTQGLSSPLSVIDNHDSRPNLSISDVSRPLHPPPSSCCTFDPFNTSMPTHQSQASNDHARLHAPSTFSSRPAELGKVDNYSINVNGAEQRTAGHVERARYNVSRPINSHRPWWSATGGSLEVQEIAEGGAHLSSAVALLDEVQHHLQPASAIRSVHQPASSRLDHEIESSPMSERLTQSVKECLVPTAVANFTSASSGFGHSPNSSRYQHHRQQQHAPIAPSRTESVNYSTSDAAASTYRQPEKYLQTPRIDDPTPEGTRWPVSSPSIDLRPHQTANRNHRQRMQSNSSLSYQYRYCDEVGLSPSAKPLLNSMFDDGDAPDTDGRYRPEATRDHAGRPTGFVRNANTSPPISACGDNRVSENHGAVSVIGGRGTTNGTSAPDSVPPPPPPPPSTKHAENVVCSTIRIPPRMTAVSKDGQLTLLDDVTRRPHATSRTRAVVDDCSTSTNRQSTSHATQPASSAGDVTSGHPVADDAITTKRISSIDAGGGRQSVSVDTTTKMTGSISKDETRWARRRSSVAIDADDSDVRGSLATTAFQAVVSLFLGALAVQLLLRLTTMTSRYLDRSSMMMTSSPASSILSMATIDANEERSIRTVIADVAVGLTVIVVAVDLCCLLSASLQCYFVIQLSRLSNGRDRALVFIHRCRVTRVFSAAAFLLSIPIFLLALLLHAVLEYEFTSAIICIAVYIVGVVGVTATAAHSIHCWRKSAVFLRHPTAREQGAHSYGIKHAITPALNPSKAVKLSTLV